MSCNVSEIQSAACETEIGKVTDRITLLQVTAQLQSELVALAAPGTDVTLPAILERACTSGIGKLKSLLQLLRAWAQAACALTPGASPNTLRYYHGGTYTEVVAPSGSYDLSAVANLTAVYINAAPLLNDLIVTTSSTLTTVSIIDQPGMQIIALTDCTALTTFRAPQLVTIGNAFNITNAPLSGAPITSISFPLLTYSSASFGVVGLNNLTTLSAPSLTTAGAVVVASECPSLPSLDWSNWEPLDGGALLFNACAFNQATVDLVLARCRLFGLSTTTIALGGGSNSTPSAQGLLDKAALVLAGCVVTTN